MITFLDDYMVNSIITAQKSCTVILDFYVFRVFYVHVFYFIVFIVSLLINNHAQ